ncbi:MAG TPA: hypothetical protein VH281_10065 [Gaiellaceae bacterium]
MSAAAYASYCGLGLVQAALVLVPRVPRSTRLAALRPHWLLVVGPVAIVTCATFLPPVASVLADDLSTLALFSIPLLSVIAIVWIRPGHAALAVIAVAVALTLAWRSVGTPLGDAAALALVALSAVAAAVGVVIVVPTTVVKVGIGAWALLDLSLALSHRLAEASHPIMQAGPLVGPHLQLQRVVLGSSSMEWADLFVAAGLGAVLAVERRPRGLAAVLVAVFAMSFSALFLVTDVLPATVPVALALLVEEVRERVTTHGPRRHPVADSGPLAT